MADYKNVLMALSPEEECLLDIVKNSIAGQDSNEGCGCRFMAGFDINRYDADILKEAISLAADHAVLSLIYDSLEEYSDVKAAGAVKAAKKSASTAFIQNNRLLYVTACITKLLADNNVKSVVLKGVSAARYYPSPFLRKSGDIDILAGDGENFECARRLIKGYGYIEKKHQHSQHHAEFVSDEGITIELHRLLAEPFDNQDMNAYMKKLASDMLAGCEMTEIMGYRIPVCTRTQEAYYLLVHMLQHFLRAGFGIKLLCDWVVFWNTCDDEDIRKDFVKMASESGILGFASMVTAVCVEYLGLRKENAAFIAYQDYDRQDVRLFMDEILTAEEFGKSANDRMVVMRGNSPADYMREFHHQMQLNNPKHANKIIMWPYLWAKTLVVFVHNNRNLRRVSTLKVMKKAHARSRIVKNMHIFSTEDGKR